MLQLRTCSHASSHIWKRYRASLSIPRPYTQHRWNSSLSLVLNERLEAMKLRHDEILHVMNSAGHTQPSLGKELSSLSTTVSLLEDRDTLDEEYESMNELLVDSRGDSEMENECFQELERIAKAKEKIEEKLLNSLLPYDEEDHSAGAIVEVRAGTGGVEASLFASELVACYAKTAQMLSWKVEVLSEARTDIGGVREISILLSGNASFRIPDFSDESAGRLLSPYGVFRYESGVHRVQRVPVNDPSRIHTSACSVAVLPSVEDKNGRDNALPASELKIETMRASGAGGQHVNTTDSAVRITHLPTKIQATIQDERSQHKNKEKALKLLTARVRDQQRMEQERERGEERNSLLGSGNRSERIRTYNFPQDRVTDHRSKETRHGIDAMLSNATHTSSVVVSFLNHLKILDRQEKLEQLLSAAGADSM